MRTANLAIVFTDIKGFTERTSRQTLEQNQRLLQVHGSLLTPLFRAFGGKVVKSIGDAFLVTFESPTQAVLAGVAIQDRLWAHNRQASDAERLDVRVAINVGEVRVEGGDVFGEPVNIAARVEGIAEAGEVFFTEAVYLAMNKAEVPAEEVGVYELKGIPGKVRVFRVPHAPYRVEAPTGTDGEEDAPPFGNIGLGRVVDVSGPARGLPVAELGQRAAALRDQAGALGGKLATVSRGWLGRERRLTVGVVAAVVVLAALGFLFLRGSPAERAIADVADAPPGAARGDKLERARTLIEQEKDDARRDYLEGRLNEALGSPLRAVAAYRAAVRAGNGKAEGRLIDLLESPDCRTRVAAASVLGDLRLESARGALEDLAEEGGRDEGSDIPLFGCNSKRAAADALERLSE